MDAPEATAALRFRPEAGEATARRSRYRIVAEL